MPRFLTAAQIEQAVAALLAKDGDWISRGRGGDGFAQRGGQIFRVYVEESDREEQPISEADVRQQLAVLDLDNYTDRYTISAVQQLGVAIVGPPFPT